MADPSVHERAVELAVTALDFELDPAERSWLDAHLQGCPACRQASHAYAVDARGIERLPQVSAPARVGAKVLGTRGRGAPNRGGSGPWITVVAAMAVVAVVGFVLLRPRAPDAGPGTSAGPSATATSAEASVPSPASTPSVVASVPPGTSPPESTPPAVAGPLVWRSIEVPDRGRPREVRALSGGAGIAVATFVGTSGEPWLWWSRGGGRWADAELPAGAFGGTAPWLVEPFGAGFVALGWTDITESTTERRIWTSLDGLAWRADVEGDGRLGSMAYGLLAARDGLALAAGRAAGETLVWSFRPGGTWTPLTIEGPVREAALEGLVAVNGDFLAFGELDGAAGVWRTVDGTEWTELAAPPDLARVDGLAIAPGGMVAWGATAIARSTPNALAWSADGVAWESAQPPPPVTPDDELVWVTSDAAGLVALWRQEDGSGVHARSSDGRSWSPVGIEGLPADVRLAQVERVGEYLVGLGLDADRRVVSYATGGG